MKRLERLVAIGETLRREAPRPVSAGRLADDFGVSRRTIERDLAALRNAGLPLYSERGRSGGQVSLDRRGNVVVTLSPSEVTALVVATTVGGSGMPWADAAATATARLLDGLAPTTRVAVDRLRSRIRAPDSETPNVRRRLRRTVETAVERAVMINLVYRDANGVETTRSVDATGFYLGNDDWYLIGWCHLRQAGRIFRLDRISRANLTRQPIGDHDVDEVLGWVPGQVTSP